MSLIFILKRFLFSDLKCILSFDFFKISFFVLCIFYYLYFHWKRRRIYKLTAKVHGPTNWPLIGSAQEFIGKPELIYERMFKYLEKFPGLGRVWLGPVMVYTIQTPEHMEIVLKHPDSLHKAYVYQFLDRMVGHGLVAAPVNIWKRNRKLIAPSFNSRILDTFGAVFNKHALLLCEKMKTIDQNNNFDYFFHLNSCTLDTICETALGIQMDKKDQARYLFLIDQTTAILFKRMINVFYHNQFIFNLSSMGIKYNKLSKEMRNFTENIILGRLEKFKEMKKNNSFIDDNDPNHPKPFADHLLDLYLNGNGFTLQQLKDEVDSFLIAGFDTTAKSMGFLICLLGMHPDIQEKVFKEVKEVLDLNQPFLATDLPKLKYTERAIKEALRLFPSVPFGMRNINGEISLKDGRSLAKGTIAFLAIIRMHRNPDYWPDPLKFDPDRFLPEAVSKRHPYAYLPFSAGPRNCIGMNYGMRAIKTMIAVLVRNCYFTCEYKNVEDIKIKVNLMILPVDGFKIGVQMRKE